MCMQSIYIVSILKKKIKNKAFVMKSDHLLKAGVLWLGGADPDWVIIAFTALCFAAVDVCVWNKKYIRRGLFWCCPRAHTISASHCSWSKQENMSLECCDNWAWLLKLLEIIQHESEESASNAFEMTWSFLKYMGPCAKLTSEEKFNGFIKWLYYILYMKHTL